MYGTLKLLTSVGVGVGSGGLQGLYVVVVVTGGITVVVVVTGNVVVVVTGNVVVVVQTLSGILNKIKSNDVALLLPELFVVFNNSLSKDDVFVIFKKCDIFEVHPVDITPVFIFSNNNDRSILKINLLYPGLDISLFCEPKNSSVTGFCPVFAKLLKTIVLFLLK
jgi:hypothetical protein